MKTRLLLTFLAVLIAYAVAGDRKPRYVPLSCVARMTILDWGKCSQDGQVWHCPNASLQFTEGCSSAKPEQSPAQLNISRPAMILKDEK